MKKTGIWLEPFIQMFSKIPDMGDEIIKLFDSSFDCSAENNQVKLNGLAMLLNCLENYDEDEDGDSSLHSSLLCKMQALQAAYILGKNSRTAGSK